jgi:hypothetical protein
MMPGEARLMVQVFNVVPTFLEVSLVAGILAYKCGPAFAGLTAATITLYTLVTFGITSVSLAPLLVRTVMFSLLARQVTQLQPTLLFVSWQDLFL